MTVRLTRQRPALLRLAAPVAVVLTLLGATLPARAGSTIPAQANPPRGPLVDVQGGTFTLEGRPLPYPHGINYEGPTDRPWRMWQDGLFSSTLIGRDFDRIAAAGYNPVRIFIQHPLPQMILSGDFSRLDAVAALAAQRGLRLLITFNDDGDPDLRRVTRVESLVAAHYAGNPAIFGYDLRNEPSLTDIGGSIYPAGTSVPLLSPAVITSYHEVVSMATVRAVQRGSSWSSGGFAAMNTKTLYYYINAKHILNRFMSQNPDYPAVAPAQGWMPFLDVADHTLATYIGVQLAAIRAVDPAHLVTVGFSSRFWSALPANKMLNFRSIHVYPPADFEGFHNALRRFEVLNGLAPSPLMLEEYGVSNDLNGPQSSAVREMAAALYLRVIGGGGDMKWMFDDDAVGFNTYENNLGAVDISGAPKPTYLASAAADAYWSRTPYTGGLILQPDPVTGAGFTYMARDGLAIGGSAPYADARVWYTPAGAGIVWLDWSRPGRLRMTATTHARVTVDLGRLTGATGLVTPVLDSAPQPTATASPVSPTATISGTTVQPLSPTATISGTPLALATPTVTPTVTPAPTITPAVTPTPTMAMPAISVSGGLTVTVMLQPGMTQVIAYRTVTGAPPVPIDLPAPALPTAWYVISRGHNVAPPFLVPWQTLGGASGIGLPLTEQFSYHGLPTQYFDDVALRIGPQGLTTAPIGVVALNGARPAARELPKRILHVYDRATGHNIHGFFLDYWRRHGGLRFWGDPLTEEIKENGRTVQYFSGAEFALTTGRRVDVTLLPLGRRMWPRIRSVYGL